MKLQGGETVIINALLFGDECLQITSTQHISLLCGPVGLQQSSEM
jgi:hypothetical protein